MEPLAPIPTPPAQRWREFRIQALPVVTFLCLLVGVVLLWREYVMPANIIGEVEAVRANIISAVPGTIRELKVKRFDRVKAGEEIAQIATMDPDLFQASLRAIEADLKLMRARMHLDTQRNDVEYQNFRLQYLNERADLVLQEVNAKYYESEVTRQHRLLTNNPPLIDMTVYEFWVRLAESTRTNVLAKRQALSEREKLLPTLQPAKLEDDVIVEDIKAQEEKLRASDQVVSIKSPIDGMVSMVEHLQGERIVENLPILTISAVQSARIVGWVRRPFSDIPKPGDEITIRRQTFKREVARGTVTEVSGQLEPISATLVPAVSGQKVEMGLPFAVSIPAELAAALIPGEPVDLIFLKR